MQRLKCKVAYLGTNYNGWQSQKNNNTIQDNIEKALQKVIKKKSQS